MSEPIFSVLTGKLSLTQIDPSKPSNEPGLSFRESMDRIDFDHEGYQAPWRCLRRCPKDIWRN
jgi:hypothetical protein